jgi:galactokinase
MIDRHNAVLLKFKEQFGGDAGVGLARAPGRVNIIGEHTDYNDGLVLPIAIARDTLAAFRPNESRDIRVFSMALDESASLSLDGELPDEPPWARYVGGVAHALSDENVELVGTDMVVHTTLPVGGGLSSSAALEVSAGLALTSAAGAEIDRGALARLCQRAENESVGMRCGIMDQYVALFAKQGSAVQIDCRSLTHTLVPCVTDTAKFVVCDTGVHHELAASEYNRRRQECETGAAEAARVLTGQEVTALRDVEPGALSALQGELDPVVFRRVRHVVTENARVTDAAQAMEQQNYIALGVLMDASHESLRDDYEVSCAELDAMVEAAWSQPGVYGSRMTGGGFGGCTISLVDAARVDDFCEGIAATYRDQTGLTPAVYVCTPEGGADVLRPAG